MRSKPRCRADRRDCALAPDDDPLMELTTVPDAALQAFGAYARVFFPFVGDIDIDARARLDNRQGRGTGLRRGTSRPLRARRR